MKTVSEMIDGISVVTQIWMVRGDDEELLVPIHITEGSTRKEYEMQPGDMLTLTVRSAPSEDSPVLVEISGAPGINRIPIRHADTAGMEPGKYSADIQLTTQDGMRKTIWPDYNPASSRRYRPVNMQNFVLLAEVTAK